MRDDLGIDTTRLGAVVALYFAAAALAAVPGGRVAERFGAKRALVGANACTAASLLAVALFAHHWLHLLVALCFAGTANGMLQPAGNLAMMRGVARRRQGIAFGIKQSAGPIGTMLAGLAIPLIALTLGWRWAFAAAILPLPLIALVLPRDHAPVVAGGPRPRPNESMGTLIRIAVAVGFGFAAATTLGTFFIDSVVNRGGDPETGAVALTTGSISCVLVRLGVGWRTDRSSAPSLRLVAALIGFGSLGYLALAVADTPALWLVGVLLGLGVGWGWPGLLHHSVAAANPAAPAAATGITTVGIASGAVVGPLLFGVVAEQASYTLAWLLSAAMALVAAGLLVDATRRTAA